VLKAEIKESVVVIKRVTPKPYHAVINGDRVECAKCGSLLMTLNPKSVKVHNSIFAERMVIGTTKCDHRHQGERCGAMNDIYI